MTSTHLVHEAVLGLTGTAKGVRGGPWSPAGCAGAEENMTTWKRNTTKMAIRGSHLNKVAQNGLEWSRGGFMKEETHT